MSEQNRPSKIGAGQLTIGFSDTVRVKRLANTGNGVVVYDVGITNAPIFLCNVMNPSASPNFSFPIPRVVDDGSGFVVGQQRAFYDPVVGAVKFIVEAKTSHPTYGFDETWDFTFFLLYPSLQ